MFFNYFAFTVCLSSGSTTRTTADYCNDQERIISQVLILIARDSHNLDLTELRSLFFCYLKERNCNPPHPIICTNGTEEERSFMSAEWLRSLWADGMCTRSAYTRYCWLLCAIWEVLQYCARRWSPIYVYLSVRSQQLDYMCAWAADFMVFQLILLIKQSYERWLW